jgi:Na+/H+ antiporter NhaD/arsenite permease-like protein
MLLLPFAGRQPASGYALALSSTFAGNAVLVGSIANLIVAEQAGRLGIRFGFREHLGSGLPVALISLLLAAAAMLLW